LLQVVFQVYEEDSGNFANSFDIPLIILILLICGSGQTTWRRIRRSVRNRGDPFVKVFLALPNGRCGDGFFGAGLRTDKRRIATVPTMRRSLTTSLQCAIGTRRSATGLVIRTRGARPSPPAKPLGFRSCGCRPAASRRCTSLWLGVVFIALGTDHHARHRSKKATG